MSDSKTKPIPAPQPADSAAPTETPAPAMPKETPPKAMPKEIGGPAGKEPTRYGDWERNGRCSDF